MNLTQVGKVVNKSLAPFPSCQTNPSVTHENCGPNQKIPSIFTSDCQENKHINQVLKTTNPKSTECFPFLLMRTKAANSLSNLEDIGNKPEVNKQKATSAVHLCLPNSENIRRTASSSIYSRRGSNEQPRSNSLSPYSEPLATSHSLEASQDFDPNCSECEKNNDGEDASVQITKQCACCAHKKYGLMSSNDSLALSSGQGSPTCEEDLHITRSKLMQTRRFSNTTDFNDSYNLRRMYSNNEHKYLDEGVKDCALNSQNFNCNTLGSSLGSNKLPRTLSTSVLRIKHRSSFWNKFWGDDTKRDM